VSIKFTTNPTQATIKIGGLVFDYTQTSTADTGDISTFHLYRDAGTIGTYDAALDVLLDDVNVTFGMTSVNFNEISPVLNVTGSGVHVLVTIDVKSGANGSHDLGLKLSGPNSINFDAASQVVNGPNSSINKDNFSDLGTISDVPLPVQLSTFNAIANYGKVILEWETSSELNNEGFFLYRAESQNGDYGLLNQEIIAGQGNSNTLHSYQFVDENVQEGKTYYYQIITRDFNGTIHEYPSIVSATVLEIPETFNIDQNYPNPFNPRTTFRFSIPEPSWVGLTIYNILGQKVRTIFDNRLFDVGVYDQFSWDATDDAGNVVANGIYYYVFQIPDQNFRQVKKMVLTK
jgi:hypothetical protein